MTRIEAVSRAIYMERMAQVGLPNFRTTPFDQLPPIARKLADDVALAALSAADAWPAQGVAPVKKAGGTP